MPSVLRDYSINVLTTELGRTICVAFTHQLNPPVRKQQKHKEENAPCPLGQFKSRDVPRTEEKRLFSPRRFRVFSSCLEDNRIELSLDVKVFGLGISLERKVLFTSLSVCTNCRLNKPNLLKIFIHHNW